MLSKLSLFLVLALTTGMTYADEDALSVQQIQDDLNILLKDIQENYAYFNIKQTDWAKVREIYLSKGQSITTRNDFIRILEEVLDELYDSHSHLNTNLPDSFRLVPSGADIWAKWMGGRAVITEVRKDSDAQRAGLQAGMEIVAVNNIPVGKATDAKVGKALKAPDPNARDWALRALLAGRHNEPRHIQVHTKRGIRKISINDRNQMGSTNTGALLDSRRMGEFGYIKINNSLGDFELVKGFDEALEELKDTHGLILDLRNTPSGGNTTVARGILSRFIVVERAYQKHIDPSEERMFGVKRSWIEWVSPRGAFAYTQPVVVLVDHWTGSVGEAMAIGFDGMERATIVGTEMAGLLGATAESVLPNSHIHVHIATERLYHVNGTPREQFIPSVYVDLLSKNNKDLSDPILSAGVVTLKARTQ